MAQREPIVTAKAIATLDRESHGRFVLGIGFGWNEDEIANHGIDMLSRRDVTREHMLAMKALWRDDTRRTRVRTCRSHRRGRGPNRRVRPDRRC